MRITEGARRSRAARRRLMPSTMRHTKIVATLGPASSSPRYWTADPAGADVFRLELLARHARFPPTTFRAVRDAAARARAPGRHPAGPERPKIRTGTPGRRPARRAARRRGAAHRRRRGRRPRTRLHAVRRLVTSAGPGDRAAARRRPDRAARVERNEQRARHTVVDGGPLGEHKGINAPGVPLPASAVTDEGRRGPAVRPRLGVDLVALSFVQTPQDVTRSSDMPAQARDVPLIAKIERPQRSNNLDAILAASDGVMVARGDLGLECRSSRCRASRNRSSRGRERSDVP